MAKPIVNFYLKIGDRLREATFKDANDPTWQGREVKYITFDDQTVESVKLFLYDNVSWSILTRVTREVDEETYTEDSELDCSEYSLRGDITEHRNGNITVVMGKGVTPYD